MRPITSWSTGISLKRLLAYAALLVPSLVVAAVVWDHIAVDKLFYCTDSCGAFDFIPPFIHWWVPGDHYVASPVIVWGLWLLLLELAVAVPWGCVWVATRLYEHFHHGETAS